MRSRRTAAALLTLASPALLVGFWIGGAVGELLVLLLAGLFPVALIALGASRGAPWRGRSTGFLLLLFAILAGSLGAVWMLRGRVEEMPWIGGLPLAAAIQLYGLWLLPLVLAALVYALTFEASSSGSSAGGETDPDRRDG